MKAALWNYYATNYKAFTLSMTSYWLKAIRMRVCAYVHAQEFLCACEYGQRNLIGQGEQIRSEKDVLPA